MLTAEQLASELGISSRQVQRLADDLREPVLLLSSYRPGYAAGTAAGQMTLAELSPRQTGELLHSLLRGEPPAELARYAREHGFTLAARKGADGALLP